MGTVQEWPLQECIFLREDLEMPGDIKPGFIWRNDRAKPRGNRKQIQPNWISPFRGTEEKAQMNAIAVRPRISGGKINKEILDYCQTVVL